MLKKIWVECNKVIAVVSKDNISAHAAQAAFFLVLSLFPIMLLLFTLVQFTPLTQEIIIGAVKEVFPKSFNGLIINIVNQVYNQSTAVIPITILATLWSAGRGVLAMTSGLNAVYGKNETRGYIFIRIRSTIYTVLFIITIVCSLSMLVFGNRISVFVKAYAPVMSYITDFVIDIRTVLALLVLTLFSMLIYGYLPNHKGRLKGQLPGALFSATGWLLVSFVFSMYLDIFTGFSDMYGSMTTIVLVMLWFYMCMYIMLLGAEVNQMLFEKKKLQIE